MSVVFVERPQYRVNVSAGGTYSLSVVPSSITVPSVLMNQKLRSVHGGDLQSAMLCDVTHLLVNRRRNEQSPMHAASSHHVVREAALFDALVDIRNVQRTASAPHDSNGQRRSVIGASKIRWCTVGDAE